MSLRKDVRISPWATNSFSLPRAPLKSITLVKLTVVHQLEILWDRLGQAGTAGTHSGPSRQADDDTVLGVDPDLTRKLGNVFFVLGELRDWLTQVNVRLPDGLAGAGDVSGEHQPAGRREQ